MSSRPRRRSGKSPRWLFVLIGMGLLVVVLALLAPMLVMNWVRGYLQQEAFRGQMERFFGTQLQGEVALTPLRWTGDEVTATEATVKMANGWQAEIGGLHLGLDWNAFRQGTWRVVGTGADDVALTFAPAATRAVDVPEMPTDGGEMRTETPLWLRRYLPDKTEIDGVMVDRLSLRYPGPWSVTEAKVRIGTWQQGETSAQVVVEKGILETPIQIEAQPTPLKFNLNRASTRISRDELHLKEVSLSWLGDSEITARGHLRPTLGTWKVTTNLKNIPLRECVNEDWKLRLTGLVEGDLEIEGRYQTLPTVEGDVRLREGVLTTLPILDRLATYTGVERFKRLVLDIASAQVSGSGDARHFEKIILQSNGLLRLEGTLHVQGGQLDGSFLLGVTPETLKWIPGAQQHVFNSPNPAGPVGMIWTPLRITGNIDSPREDLSERLITGAGKALLSAPADIAGKGTELLLSPVLGQEAAGKPGEVLKGATDAAGKAAETGVKLLEGLGGGLLGR